MRLARRMGRLGTESAFEVLVRAKALEATGRKVIHMELGEPDFSTPEHIVQAAEEALRAGHTHYVPAPGIHELREAQRGQGRRRFIEDERMMRVMSAAYYGAIAHVDYHVGKLLDELDKPDAARPCGKSNSRDDRGALDTMARAAKPRQPFPRSWLLPSLKS